MPTQAEVLISRRPTTDDRSSRIGPPSAPLPEGLRERVAVLHKAWDDQAAARGALQKVLDMADGDQLDHVPTHGDEDAAHWAEKPHFAPNLLGYAVDRLSSLYLLEPMRSGTDAEEWRRVLWDRGHGLTSIMLPADRELRLCGTMAAVVWPGFGDGPQELEAIASLTGDPDGLEVVMLPPTRWVAAPNASDPRHLGAIAIYAGTVEQRTADNVSTSVEVRHYWDDEVFAVLHGWAVVEGQVWQHGLGAPPVVLVASTPSSTLWGRPVGGRDLERNITAINRLWTEIGHTARLQRGQPWASQKPPDGFVMAPDAPWVIPDGVCGILANGANLEGMLATLNAEIEAFSIAIGVPRRVLRLRDVLAGSAAGVVAEALELGQDRLVREVVMRRGERDIHRIAAMVWRHHTGQDLDWRVTVRYPHPRMALDADQQIAWVETLDKLVIADPFELAQQLYPDRTEDELRAMLARAEKAKAKRQLAAAVVGHGEVPAIADAAGKASGMMARQRNPYEYGAKSPEDDGDDEPAQDL